MSRHLYFLEQAIQKHETRLPIQAKRGRILDRYGEELAMNIPSYAVYLDGTHVTHPEDIARIVAPYLEMPIKKLSEKLITKRAYVLLYKNLSEEKAEAMMHALEANKLHGLYLTASSVRSYPNGEMLCSVLGYVDHTGHGIDGIEKKFDKKLIGEDGFRIIEHDRKGREIVVYRRQEKLPRNGSDIRLTIDMGLQAIVEHEIKDVYKMTHAASVTAILADPNTGEILALAGRPNYDPNKFNLAKPDQMRNRAISDVYEPGSVFKIVVTSAAYNEGIVDDRTRIFCEHGRFLYGKKVIKDHHGYGDLSVPEILMKSSNIGASKIVLMMKDQMFYEYVKKYGFGAKTGISLPGEAAGIVQTPDHWDMLTKTRMAYGHSIAVTTMQMLMAMSAIANGGKLLKPKLVLNKAEANSGLAQVSPIHQVVKSETARYINYALKRVVSKEGTAQLAAIPGYSVSGKTGTAQKINLHGGYLKQRYIVSFAGFFPSNHPKLIAIVSVDDAKLKDSLNYGGSVAGPVFAKIASQAARYLNMQPEEEDSIIPSADHLSSAPHQQH